MKKIFVSYSLESDEPYRRLLEQFAKDKGVEFVSIAESAGTNWQENLKQSIEQADQVMVLVGERTHQSKWVEQEVNEATATGKPVVVLKAGRNTVTPAYLYGKGVTWGGELTADAIAKIAEEPLGGGGGEEKT